MVQSISSNNPDFQYGGSKAVPQDNDPSNFQSYLNQQDAPSHLQSPMDMISAHSQSNFGAPTTESSSNLGPAPENFGPPGISQVSGDNSSNFGAPGFGADQTSQVGDAQPGSGPLGPGGTHKPPPPTTTHLPPQHTGPTIKSVEQQEADNMLNAAIGDMKITDPDPDAWK